MEREREREDAQLVAHAPLVGRVAEAAARAVDAPAAVVEAARDAVALVRAVLRVGLLLEVRHIFIRLVVLGQVSACAPRRTLQSCNRVQLGECGCVCGVVGEDALKI